MSVSRASLDAPRPWTGLKQSLLGQACASTLRVCWGRPLHGVSLGGSPPAVAVAPGGSP